MFRIHDTELTETELTLFEQSATVEPDGLIVFNGQSRRAERGSFNVAEVLLEWHTEEEFGVQRVRFGNETPLTRAAWQRKLSHRTRTQDSQQNTALATRRQQVRACFPAERVKFRVLGWRLMNVEFYNPACAIRIPAASEARITRVVLRCSDKFTSRRGARSR